MKRGRANAALAGVLIAGAAGLLYHHDIGDRALGASEAYSAWIAAKPGTLSVVRAAMLVDPGKPPLYHLLLHWMIGDKGSDEHSLRILSAGCGVASVWLTYSLGSELFGAEVGVGAALLWAIDPVAVVEARWARMYSMFVALTLLHLWAMERRRRGGSAVFAGLSGAAMLYTHLCALLIIAGDIIVAIREWRQDGKIETWSAIALAAALFLPFGPVAFSQGSSLLFGHWLDWMGEGRASLGGLIGAGASTAALFGWFAFAPRGSGDRAEAFQRCLIYGVTPIIALVAASIAVRPSFSVRYISPSVCLLTIGFVYQLDRIGEHWRNLSMVGLVALLLTIAPLYYTPSPEPWRAMASEIESREGRAEPVFFESGFLSFGGIAGHGNDGFPMGFCRIPFDYYFRGSNVRATIPGWDPTSSQEVIAAQVATSGGAWLVSMKPREDAMKEIPPADTATVDYEQAFSGIELFHLRAKLKPHDPQTVTDGH